MDRSGRSADLKAERARKSIGTSRWVRRANWLAQRCWCILRSGRVGDGATSVLDDLAVA
jgi:hypothetical protein